MSEGAMSRAADSKQRDPITLRWLGQSGFEITAPDGGTCLIDPYLSDWCGRFSSNPRVPPVALDPAKIRPTLVVTSHWHDDHLDPEAIPIIARSSPATVFVGPPSSAVRYRWWGVATDRVVGLCRGESVAVGAFRLTAGFARHDVPGMLAEDAISISVEVAGRRIFHSGDTEYDSRIRPVRDLGAIDVGLFVINGTGGNMNLREAAFLAAELDVGLAIPMHYGMWRPEKYGPDATLDPHEFVRRFGALSGRPGLVLEHAIPFTLP
jgi:L-ascorbate metabolism protein UlaG (beta-lactamase superfamily)